ncbi:MAG: hypothetical protein AB7T32_08715 [Dehalococcoidia bacterium]
MGRRVDPAFGATWRRTPGRQVASIVRWWFGAMLWGGFALQVLAGGLVFASPRTSCSRCWAGAEVDSIDP